jgi:hypothetical protein
MGKTQAMRVLLQSTVDWIQAVGGKRATFKNEKKVLSYILIRNLLKLLSIARSGSAAAVTKCG